MVTKSQDSARDSSDSACYTENSEVNQSNNIPSSESLGRLHNYINSQLTRATFDFEDSWDDEWTEATLPIRKDSAGRTSLLDSPEAALLKGLAKYWSRQGAKEIDRGDLFEDAAAGNLKNILLTQVNAAVADLGTWNPVLLGAKPDLLRFPTTPWDHQYARIGESHSIAVGRSLDSSFRQRYSTQFSILEAGGERRTLYVPAILLNDAREAVAYKDERLVRFFVPDDMEVPPIFRQGYRPFVAMLLSETNPTSLEVAGAPTRANDILYSPLAFHIAREMLRREGATESFTEESRMKLHLIDLIRGQVLCALTELTQTDPNFSRIDIEGLQIDSIEPNLVSGHKNDFVASCFTNNANFTVKTELYIWFPGHPETSRRPDRPTKESPFIVRCHAYGFEDIDFAY